MANNGWRRPNRCECRKIPYRDETAALAAAASRCEDAGVPLHVYRCPGSRSWHLTSRGFRPESLKSRARIVAWHISVCRTLTWAGLLRKLGLDPDADQDRTPIRKVKYALAAFTELGLIARSDTRPPYITAADANGLLRVMAVGLEEYAAQRGFSLYHGYRLAKRGGSDG